MFETDHFSEFAVIEVETVVDRIEISSLPQKTEYAPGETLGLDGLEVIAYYSDGSSSAVTDYSVGMIKLDSAGTKTVTVYYTFGDVTKSATFGVEVKQALSPVDITEKGKSVESVNKKLGLFEFYIRASIQLGSNTVNADGCTLRWRSDNSKVIVDSNGKVTCKGLFGAKKANITVEILDASGNTVAKDTVYVVFYKLSFQLSQATSQAIDVIKKIF